MSRTLHRLIPSPAMIVALVALVVSLGSSGYASQIVPTLTGDNIKDNSVTGKQIRDLTRKDIRKRSLRGRKFQLDSVGSKAIKEFWAVVDFDAKLKRGSTDLTAGDVSKYQSSPGQSSTGQYQVVFDRDVRLCSYQATIGGIDHVPPTQSSQITVSYSPDDNNAVLVRTANAAGAVQDKAFHLTVTC